MLIKAFALCIFFYSGLAWPMEETSVKILPNPDNIRHNAFPVQSPWGGIYSHGVSTSGNGKYLHVSGQLGVADTGTLPASFKEQASQAIDNIANVLDSAGFGMGDIVHMRFYLTDRSQVEDLVKVRTDKLYGLAPAVTTYIVGGLLKEEWLIEIEALAFKPGTTQ